MARDHEANIFETNLQQNKGDHKEQLNLDEEEFDDLVIDADDPEINESVRWFALARVHTDKSFSQTAFYREMCAAWNTT